MTIIRGTDAIRLAEALGVTLCKYADAIDNARAGVTVAEARAIAADDPSLIFLELPREASEPVDHDDAETFGVEHW